MFHTHMLVVRVDSLCFVVSSQRLKFEKRTWELNRKECDNMHVYNLLYLYIYHTQHITYICIGKYDLSSCIVEP